MLGDLHGSSSPSPVEPAPIIGGRKPTPRSVRIVNLQDSFVGAVEKEARFAREPTDQTQAGVHPPPKVWTRSSGVPPAAFNASAHDDVLPLPQPRFKAKNLQLQILDNPSKWMRLYFYAWPLLVLYHIPLQTFFDFNAVFILLQVAKFPNPQSSGRGWALGAAAYVASWLAWLFLVCIMYELVYSFSRRWRLRRPLMLPIYLSSPAFNYAAMTSYTNFSFLQHLRFSAFASSEHAGAIPPSPSDPDHDIDDLADENQGSWKQGLAETCFFYSQNLATVALLLPRAGLSLALLFAFSSAAPVLPFVVSNNFSNRDGTFFQQDGALTDYARGLLIANAAWTAWRLLVLLVSWLGLWVSSDQRLGGLCGPRHTWEEAQQEKTRSVYSEAASEYGAYRGSFYHPGDGVADYGGDELPWEWREATRIRVQDAFEFCMTTRRGSAGSAAGLRWSGVPVPGYGYALRNRRSRNKHKRWSSAAKGKAPSNEKAAEAPFEGLERVLAAAGFAATASPSRRKTLSEDLFNAPALAPNVPHHPTVAPLRFEDTQPMSSAKMYTGLEAPKTAKRNSKDKIPGSSTAPGAPLMNLPYPFSKPGSGHVSSKDSVPFPASGSGADMLKAKASPSVTGSSGTTGSTESGSGSGSTQEEEDEEEEEDEDEDAEELDDDDEEEDADLLSEEPSSGRASGSMSSLGQPISPSRAYLGRHRPVGAGHSRNMSGVSSALSGGSHVNSQSMSSSHGTKSVAGMSLVTQSTGNHESTDSEFGPDGRERASLSQGSPMARSSPLAGASGAFPMPPRHPHPQGQGRGRSATAPSGKTTSAAVTLNTQSAPIAFPSVRQRGRVESGRGIMVDPAVLFGDHMSSDFDGHELQDDDNGDGELEDADEEEQHDSVGLLGVPTSPRTSLLGASRISLTNSSSSGDARSRAHSASRSRHSSTHDRSRSRTHSSQSVRDRANSLGASMRSLVQGATASLTQLDLVMRGATGPAAGLGGLGLGMGSRPRSRVNSSMARLEEGVEFSPSATEMAQRGREVSGMSNSSGSGSHTGSEDVMLHPAVGRFRREHELESEGYSSGGSHSRSGSESISLSTENYTFGRPMMFMRPAQGAQEQSRVDEEDEIMVVDRADGTPGRRSPERSLPIPITTRSAEQNGSSAQPISESFTSASFYSLNPSDRTASPATPVPIHSVTEDRDQSPSPPHSAEHSPERQGVAIPWNNRGLLAPPGDRWGPSSYRPLQGAATTGSDSPDMISTAAGSFVTAPATIEGNTTTTDSSGGRTISGSWETSAPTVRRSGVRSGGMVERPGDDMGLDAGAWRVV
ncbi:hypothetical protein BJ912DRAFT_932469 [Pholiota molesta]|nr:hypothetical protein BJ912DRAFT_932469 [Pholiota molesta]